MQGYIILIIAIIGEVFGSSMLKASNGFKRVLPIFGVVIGYGLAFYTLSLAPSVGAIVGYVLSFYFLGLTLKTIPLSLAYAIWFGVGTALTALVSVVLWGEVLSNLKLIGIVLIISGVVVLNTTKNNETATTASN